MKLVEDNVNEVSAENRDKYVMLDVDTRGARSNVRERKAFMAGRKSLHIGNMV